MDSKEQTAVVCGVGGFIGGHPVQKPLANNGRHSDNTLLLEKLGREPSINLRNDGLETTYHRLGSEIATGEERK